MSETQQVDGIHREYERYKNPEGSEGERGMWSVDRKTALAIAGVIVLVLLLLLGPEREQVIQFLLRLLRYAG